MILPEQYSPEKAEERVRRPLTFDEEEELETEATQLASKMACLVRRAANQSDVPAVSARDSSTTPHLNPNPNPNPNPNLQHGREQNDRRARRALP